LGGGARKIISNPTCCKLFAILSAENSKKKKYRFFIDFTALKPILQLATELIPKKITKIRVFFQVLELGSEKSAFFFLKNDPKKSPPLTAQNPRKTIPC